MANTFQKYLKQKLKEIQLDESVYTEYIMSILEDESSDDEKRETLTDVLSGVLESNFEEVALEILNKYNEIHPKEEQPEKKPPELDVEDRLVKLLETQKLATNEVRVYTEEEKRIKEQILAQYSQLSADEEEDEEGDGETTTDPNLEKNTNFADVQARIREQRENAKLASEAKKQKDKEDREKQKQLREEKKEKRKTVKGERKR
uniref:Coiled-coil domain-containing protein 43 n=1 Tax=Culicoides sonorensis TaxID=179676 RepID=A0A336MK99_CULSO